MLWGLMIQAGSALASDPAPPHLTHAVGEDEEQVAVLLPAQEYAAPGIGVLAGDTPRVIADFSGIEAWKGPTLLEVGSPLVRRVRVWLHRDEARLRVVLDLAVNPAHLLVAHTYRASPAGVRAVLILRPVGRAPRPSGEPAGNTPAVPAN